MHRQEVSLSTLIGRPSEVKLSVHCRPALSTLAKSGKSVVGPTTRKINPIRGTFFFFRSFIKLAYVALSDNCDTHCALVLRLENGLRPGAVEIKFGNYF